MSRKVAKLATCVGCRADVPAVDRNIMGQKPHPQGIMVIFECPECRLVQHRLMLPEEIRRHASEAKRSVREDARRRQIGTVVKGFAVDLEVVETIEDIVLFWDYQESVNPGSIPLEDRMWKDG